MNKKLILFVAAAFTMLTVSCNGERQQEGGKERALPPSSFKQNSVEQTEEKCSPFADQLSDFASEIDISSCRKFLPSNLKSTDYIVVRLTVNALGVVQSAAVVSSTYPSKRFELCLLRLLRNTEFPHTPSTTTFEVGFELSNK